MGVFKTPYQQELLSQIVLLLMVSSCFFIIGTQRSDISLALMSMVDWHAVTQPGPNPCGLNNSLYTDTRGTFVWNDDVFTQVLACYLYGVALSYFPVEYVAHKLVPKWVVSVGILLSSACNFVAPVAAKSGYQYLMLAQVLKATGHTAVVAGMSYIITKRIPSSERAIFMGYAETAFPLGNFFTVLGSGIIQANGGWESIFYIGGSFGIAWLVLWIYMVSEYFFPSVLCYKSEPVARKIPFKSPDWRFVTSKSTWGYLIAGIAVYWAYAFSVFILPLFMFRVYGVDIKTNSVVSAIPHLLQAFLFLVTSHASEFLIREGVGNRTIIRKTCLVAGLVVFGFGSAITMSLKCDQMAGCFIIIISLGFVGADRAVVLLLPKDMSPNFADFLSSIVHVSGFLAASCLPLLVGLLSHSQDGAHNWNNVFIVNTLLSIIAAILFLAFGSARIQPWNEPLRQNCLLRSNGQRLPDTPNIGGFVREMIVEKISEKNQC